jgi:predicted GH43/DUF377 family glycosyl hydrolase
MTRRYKDMGSFSARLSGTLFGFSNVAKRVLPLAAAAALPLTLVLYGNCAGTISDCFGPNCSPSGNSDGGVGDGGAAAAHYSASPLTAGQLVTDQAAASFQQQKRDPEYAVDGTDQYLFFAGSPVGTYATTSWSLGYFKAAAGNPPTWPKVAQAVSIAGRSGQWDSGDLTAPSVRISSANQPKFSLYYAANGDPSKPRYVTQIGRSTSSDGVTWTHGAPVVAVPAFSDTTINGTPAMARPDAYGATDPFVFTDGSSVVLYYAGLDCSSSCEYKILRSVSTDGGSSFPAGQVVLSKRAGVAEETGGVAGPSVIKLNGKYLLAYTAVGTVAVKDVTSTGVSKSIFTGSIGLALSSDGQSFTYAGVSAAPVIARSASSSYSEGAFSPSLYLAGSSAKLYFGGLIENTTLGGPYFSVIPADVSPVN